MPGTQTLTVSKEQLTTQAFKHLADYRQMRKQNYPIGQDWLDNAVPWDGSDTVIIPWDVDNHSSPTPLTTGYERWSDTVSTTMINGQMSPAWVVQPVMISEIDEKLNSGRGKVIDRMKKNVENVDRHFRENIDKFVATGPSDSNLYVAPFGFSSWNTLNGVDFPTSGFFEAVVTGTNTLHNVSKGTYPPTTHPQFHNLYFDIGSAAGANLANQMYQACLQLQLQDQWPVASEFTWYMSLLAAGFLKRSFRSLEQYVATGKIDDGARIPVGPGGVPIKVSNSLPQQGTNTVTAKVSVLGVNWKRGVKPMLFSGWGLDMTEFVDIPGTAGVRAAIFKLGGNTACQQPGLNVLGKNGEVY